MATFIGTTDEFIALFGGSMLSNAVTHYATKYKEMVNVCSEPGCNKRTELESAHDHEKNSDRLVYAKALLQLYPTNIGGEHIVDLTDFMKKFFYLHLPLHDSITIKCKNHHKKFDKNRPEFFLSVDEVKAKLANAPKDVEFNEKVLPVIKCREVKSYKIFYLPDQTTFMDRLQDSTKFYYHIHISDGLGTIVTREWSTRPGKLSEENFEGNIRSNSFIKKYVGKFEKIVVSIEKDSEGK